MLSSQGTTCCGQPLEKNIGETERMLSVAGGSVLVLWGGKNLLSLNGLAAVALGGSLLLRGLSGHCGLYKLLHIRSDEPAPGVPPAAAMGPASAMGPANSTRPAGAAGPGNNASPAGRLDRVAEGSDESFPASDAPGWIGSSASGSHG